MCACVGVFAWPAACPRACVLFGQQGAAWVVGDPWLTLDVSQACQNNLGGLGKSRQGCCSTAAGALRARVNSDSGREGAQGAQGDGRQWGSAKAGCSHLHRLDLKI